MGPLPPGRSREQRGRSCRRRRPVGPRRAELVRLLEPERRRRAATPTVPKKAVIGSGDGPVAPATGPAFCRNSPPAPRWWRRCQRWLLPGGVGAGETRGLSAAGAGLASAREVWGFSLPHFCSSCPPRV